MELLSKEDFDFDKAEIEQFYAPDGKPTYKQIRYRRHLIHVRNEQHEDDYMPKTLLPTADALLLTVIVFFGKKK